MLAEWRDKHTFKLKSGMGPLGSGPSTYQNAFGQQIKVPGRSEALGEELGGPIIFALFTGYKPSGAANGVLNPSEINFMQSSIKNATGEFTVLGNAQALKSGALNPEVLRMNVWKDATGKVWTLDHRRLAAFRLSGLEQAPVQWANPAGQMWKMTTTNGGSSVWLKFGGGNGVTVR